MPKPFTVVNVGGVPVVEFHDHRSFNSARELSEALVAALNKGGERPASTEETARAVVPAALHRRYVLTAAPRRIEQYRALSNARLSVKDKDVRLDATHATQHATSLVRDLRTVTSQLQEKPDTKAGGLGTAILGERAALDGSTGRGNNWTPGPTFAALVESLSASYPAGDPIRSMLAHLLARL